jgi:hypothetical protein
MYSGPDPFSGPNPRPGVGISYFLKEKPASGTRFSLTVNDSEGNRITTLRGSKNQGLNQVNWNLRVQAEAQAPSAPSGGRFRRSFGGSYCYPGEYTVVLELGDDRYEQVLTVKADPRHTFTLAERRRNREFVEEIGAFNQRGANLIRDMEALDTQLKDVEGRLRTARITDQALTDKLQAVKKKVAVIREAYSYSVEGRTGYRRPVMVALRGGTLPEQLSRLRGSVSRYQGAPAQNQIDHFNAIKNRVEPLLQAAAEIRQQDIPEINRMLNALNFPVIKQVE